MYSFDSDLALTVIRVAAGLAVAAHGAQKVFGSFGGPGLAKWHGAVASMGFAQPRVMATAAAFVELFGGIALALGLYTPIVAAMLCIDMLVAVWKVHMPRGFFVATGGYEYALILGIVYAVLGLGGASAYSVDRALGISGDATWFVVVFLAGLLLTAGAAVAGQPRGSHRTA